MSIIGSILIIYALLEQKLPRLIVSLFVGCVLIGISIALYTSIPIGLIVIFLFGGTLVALLYLAGLTVPTIKIKNLKVAVTAIVLTIVVFTSVSLLILAKHKILVLTTPRVEWPKITVNNLLALMITLTASFYAIVSIMGGKS